LSAEIEKAGSGVSIVEGKSWTRWLHDVRRIEFEAAVEHILLAEDSTALEIGCGDGFQLNLLRRRFGRVLGIDAGRLPPSPEGCVFACTESLPFPDGTFDLVFSCHVVEHIEDRARAMAEVGRVVCEGGYVVHIVPTRFWKATSLLLNPIGYPIRVWEKWRQLRERHQDKNPPEILQHEESPPGLFQVFGRWIYPPIHGSFPSHWSEFQSFGQENWRTVFRRAGLQPVAEIPLLSYTQFGFLRFRLLGLRTRLAHHGFASSLAFIFQKS
jgi:SAM-dependent methyltransferase